MPKAQVLVTVTAEALVDVPADVVDVEAYCRERVGLAWGDLHVDGIVQPPAITIEHYLVPEPEPEPELAPAPEPTPEPAPPEPEPVAPVLVGAQPSGEDTLPLPALRGPETDDFDLVSLFNDPMYGKVIRSAVRERAERLLEEVVTQVVAELEPLLQRHLNKNVRGAQ